MFDRGEVRGLGLVAARVCRHQVLQAILRIARPGKKVIDVALDEATVAIEAATSVQLAERAAQRDKLRPLESEEVSMQVPLAERQAIQVVNLAHPTHLDEIAHDSVKPRQR